MLIIAIYGVSFTPSKRINIDTNNSTIVIAVDVSPSMNVIDYGNESRLNEVKRQIKKVK